MANPRPKASPSPQATKKSQVVVTTGRGTSVTLGDLGKKAPTPPPARIGTMKDYTPAQYDAILKKWLKDNKNR